MKYSKIFQYAYLVFAVLFVFDAITKYLKTGELAYPSILLAGLAVFMFYFRRRFANKQAKKDS